MVYKKIIYTCTHTHCICTYSFICFPLFESGQLLAEDAKVFHYPVYVTLDLFHALLSFLHLLVNLLQFLLQVNNLCLLQKGGEGCSVNKAPQRHSNDDMSCACITAHIKYYFFFKFLCIVFNDRCQLSLQRLCMHIFMYV